MDLKKIMALAMIAFLWFPSLTMARADPDDPDDGAGLAGAIERARLYLDKVRNLADNMAEEYSADPDHMIHGYLDEIYDLIDQDYEDPSAMYYLDQASTYLGTGDFNLTARNLAAARNILGRVKGLLNSMVKAHKVARTESFIRQFEHRIEGLENKIVRLRGRFGGSETSNMMASMGLAKGKIHQLGEDLSEDNLDDVIDELEITTESIDEDLEEMDSDGISPTLMTIDRLEAKIRVLNATANRLRQKGMDVTEIEEDLENAKAMLDGIIGLLETGDTDAAEGFLEDAENLVSEISDEIRGIRKGH
ncbi:MAG: hypothetical protein NWE89_06140 [Candidatus Bathyarchaeota archaeon]|nr:hypothetical protein [Candidatus Bathyarchaeota archaeon]